MNGRWGCSMRPPSRWLSDPADAIIRRTLRGWVSSAEPPALSRKRLLAAVIAGTGPGLAAHREGLAARALHSLRAAVRAARADRPPEAVGLAFEYALVPTRPSRVITRASRSERWHMFSFDVMVLTLIR